MKAFDFQYGERTLSSFGFVICRFDSGGMETINGATITFNTIPVLNGQKHELISTQYEDCLETTIQICKHSCPKGIEEITHIEHREIVRWLNRKKFLKLKFFDESHIDLYYEAAVTSINKIELDGKLIGLELNIITNRPFALKDEKTVVIKNLVKNGKHSVQNASDEEGYLYPYTEITINESGNLNIYNAFEDRNVFIANCVAGEVITMDYPIIQSTVSSHNINNDFNWNFFRIARTYSYSRNDLTISIPCTIKIKYSPITKVGI